MVTTHVHPRLGGQGVDIGGVGDPGQPDHGHPQVGGVLLQRRQPSWSVSSASSQTSVSQGSTPANGTPVRRVSSVSPGSSTDRSPRNLLITKLVIKARSASSSSAQVP